MLLVSLATMRNKCQEDYRGKEESGQESRGKVNGGKRPRPRKHEIARTLWALPASNGEKEAASAGDGETIGPLQTQ